jgi:hypothetical protein
MQIRQKWLKTVGVATSLPSSIIALYYGAFLLVENNLLSKALAFGGATLILILLLSLMVVYAFKSKS